MFKRKFLAFAVATAVIAPAVPAFAKRMPPPPPTAPATSWHFDKAGWSLLGAQTVSGKSDTDTIVVGKYDGKFDQLSVVVEDSDIELKELMVYFANGEKWSPALKHTFKEGQRSKSIDLPGTNRTISKITLSYANLPGGGKATVAVYGRDTKQKSATPAQPPVPPQPPAPYHFDDKGWTKLGTGQVNGKKDKDTVRVNGRGQFDQITMVVTDSDLELKDLTFVFSNGQRWSPKVAQTFKEGARTRVIDLPGKDRKIAKIELSYANLPGGGKASVELYGRDLGRPAPPKIEKVKWENTGWTYLGQTTADGWHDRDTLKVNKGPFTEVMFAVGGSDVELNNVLVTFANGEKFDMKGSVAFKDGTRTRPIDLPGALRKIKSVEFAYQNLPGGGRATVEVWARKKADAAPAPTPMPPAPPQPVPSRPDVRDHR